MVRTQALPMPEERNFDLFDIPLPSVRRLESHVVQIDTSVHDEPTIMIRFDGLMELASYFICERDTDECDINVNGYLGMYRFEEGIYHVVCPALADPELLEDVV